MKRAEGHRLLIYSAVAGLIFLLIAVVLGALPFKPIEFSHTYWNRLVPIPDSGKVLIAFLLGTSSWFPLNFLFDDQREIDRIIWDMGDPLEIALRRAMGRGEPMMFELSDSKILIGIVLANYTPALPVKSVSIVPLIGGFRDPNTKVAVFTKPFQSINKFIEAVPSSASPELDGLYRDVINLQFAASQILIPFEEIKSVSSFDPSLFKINEVMPAERSRSLEPASESIEERAERHQLMSVYYFLKKEYEKSDIELCNALQLAPRNAKYHSQRGNVLERLNRLDEALIEYRQAVDLQSDLVVEKQLARLLLKMKRLVEAEAQYRKLIEIKPTDAYLINQLAIVLTEQNKLEEAEVNFREAIRLDSNSIHLYNLGEVLRRQGKWQDAEYVVRDALKLKADVNSLTLLGEALIGQEKWAEAVVAFQAAVDIDPDHPSAAQRLKELTHRMEEFQQIDPSGS